MRIVFYSSCSNIFNYNSYIIKSLPSYRQQWESFVYSHPDDDFFVVTQKPGMFFLDYEDYFESENKRKNIIIKETDSNDDFAQEILNLNPDYVIAASFWVTPYDWLPVQDGIIADILRNRNIKVLCHPVSVSMACFDKYETQKILQQNGFNYAKGICVKHDMYFCAGYKKEIKKNVYKDYVLSELKKLSFPLIIKDTLGLSSYGMTVVNTYGELCNYLNSKKNNGDRLVEEKIPGLQFGAEIYGHDGKYEVLAPFMFTVNQYGITSPKQSVKLGPVYSEKYNIQELKEELERLANVLKLEGVAQVDLVFNNGKWFIIEINPRLSGMSTTYASSFSKSLYEMLYDLLIEQNKQDNLSYTANIKFPILSDEILNDLKSRKNIKYIYQIENKNALQIREQGYCEVIISDCESVKELEDEMNQIQELYSKVTEESFFTSAKKYLQKL